MWLLGTCFDLFFQYTNSTIAFSNHIWEYIHRAKDVFFKETDEVNNILSQYDHLSNQNARAQILNGSCDS